jgi:hypothetical protein
VVRKGTFIPSVIEQATGELSRVSETIKSLWLMPVILAIQEAEIRRITV